MRGRKVKGGLRTHGFSGVCGEGGGAYCSWEVVVI